MDELEIAVFGPHGRMGSTVLGAIECAPGLSLRAALGSTDPRERAEGADVAIDFTNRESALENVRWATSQRIPIVVGTSGFSDDDLAEMAAWSQAAGGSGVHVVPNFSLSVFLAKKFATVLAGHYAEAEIVEYYGAGKHDAPSATSIDLARTIASARATCSAAVDKESRSRGEPVDGVPVHAVRMNGYLSRAEIFFGAPGESICFSFQTIDREAYMPNVVRALRAAPTLTGLIVGLDGIVDGGESA